MASIEVRTSRDGKATSYRVIWRDGGQRLSQSFKTADAARQWKSLLESVKHNTGQAERAVLSSASHAPMFEKVARLHLNQLSNVTPYTLQTYDRYLRVHLIPAFGHLDIQQITDDDVSAWVSVARSSGLAPKTVRNIHGLLHSIIKTAIRKGHRADDPCEQTRLPKASRRDDAMQFLTQSEVATLLRFTPPHFQPLVLFLVGTGLRFSEATALTSADFTDANGEYLVTVNKAWKENRETGRYIGDPKSDAAFRVVQMDPGTALAVAPLVKAAKAGQPIFTMIQGGVVTTQKFRSKVWVKAIERAQSAGLRKTPRVHDLRHTFASWQLAEGTSLPELSKIMGHESTATTYRVYSHLTPEGRRSVAEATGRAMSSIYSSLQAIES